MAGNLSYGKKLCMTELVVTHSDFASPRFYDLHAGKMNASFIFVVKGNVLVSSLKRTLDVKKGELFYLPDGPPYALTWKGGYIEYYGLHAVAKQYDSALETNKTALQRIPALSNGETLSVFSEIFSLMASGEKINKIRAISLYYDFYAKALPLLSAEEQRRFSPVLRQAIDIIEQTFAEDMPVGKIAEMCYVSPSRLYHLFQAQLGATPTAYRNELRVRKAAELLRSDASLEEIGAESGFHSVTYFREIFKAHTNLTPAEYRKKIYPNT